jgi:hypothetical protein
LPILAWVNLLQTKITGITHRNVPKNKPQPPECKIYKSYDMKKFRSEKQIRDENTDELIEKLLDMPYIFYLYFDCVLNKVEMCVDVNVIDADSIVESVKKLCEKRGFKL